MSRTKELWVFTLRYPFGDQETYVGHELRVLARHFERIRLFPLFPASDPRPLPPNVTTEVLFGNDYRDPLGALPTLLEARRLLKAYHITMASTPNAALRKKWAREVVSRLRQALYREHKLVQAVGAAYDPQRVLLYSYWTSDWATVLSLWRLRDPRVRFISRMHGFDMYDHRAKDGWQVFQDLHVRSADRFHLVARSGIEHMQERFSAARDKFVLSPMATEDHGAGPWSPDPVLRIASCSNLVPLKRVHLIAQALALVRTPVRWTHFGDGPERPMLEALVKALPPHVQVELAGSTANDVLMQHYRTTPYDVFVHMSRTEGGAPVAMQEATSFGIPLIGSDAGGTRDILNDRTGITLPTDVGAEQLASLLEAFQRGPWYEATARTQVRDFWSANFHAEVVHERFARGLTGL